MALSNKGAALLLAGGTLLALSACGGGGAVPAGSSAVPGGASQFSSRTSDASPDDSTSILKKLKKDVIIGTTVDPGNGDKGPRGVSIARITYGIKKGQLAVCNYSNSAGAAGKGTTIELLDPTAGSQPTTFVQSSKILGCAGNAFTNGNGIFAAGLMSHQLVSFDSTGKLVKAYGSPFKGPFYNTDASNPGLYAAEYMFTSDATSGTIISFSINYYGNPHPLEIAKGFAVNKKSGWGTLGPSGVQYYPKKDTLYIADGANNTIVSFNNASELLVKDEIIVNKDGKTFTCKYPKTTCGKLVYSGSPLNAPVAMAVLPNGNLVAANSANNTLVELTPAGTVLATKVVDKSKTPGVFGIIASGKTDTNTVIFYTDANDNNLHELTP